jgi:hypothetical protein
MTVKVEAVHVVEVLAECIKMGRRNLKRLFTNFAGEMSVYGTREVVHRGGLTQVRVHHDIEVLEFFENSIHGRRAYLGPTFLHGGCDGFGVQVPISTQENLNYGSLGFGNAMIGVTNLGEDFVKC